MLAVTVTVVESAPWMVTVPLLGLPGKSIGGAPRRLAYGIHLGITGPNQAVLDKTSFAEIVAGLHDDAYSAVGNALVNNWGGGPPGSPYWWGTDAPWCNGDAQNTDPAGGSATPRSGSATPS